MLFSIIWAVVVRPVDSSKVGFTDLFTGVKWNGHDWVHLSTGQPASVDDFRWCDGNPQGKTTLFTYTIIQFYVQCPIV